MTASLCVAQQVCSAQLPAIPSHFQVDEGGWVIDHQSQLMWQRCALGQSWAPPHCVGKARLLTYSQALAALENINQHQGNGYKDWKLPHLRELAFIAEPRCRNPRVRLALFPNTPSGVFWSRYTRIVNDFEPHVYTMDFASSGVALNPPEENHFVRLVRQLP